MRLNLRAAFFTTTAREIEGMRITRKKFKEATGHDPQQDDLERCNCKKAGQDGHTMCGWNKEGGVPVFWGVVLAAREAG